MKISFNPLAAEAIHIFREVAAEAENPVFLYSVGKDSAVMLDLAMKAFHPGKPPFSFLHVDTTWKFREMIDFRDKRMAELGLDLSAHQPCRARKGNWPVHAWLGTPHRNHENRRAETSVEPT